MIPSKRIFLCLLLVGFAVCDSTHGQRANRRPKIELLREINLEEGKQRLESFRRMWIVGDFSLKYSLQFIPRRGKRQEVKGTLWSSNVADGPVSLIQIHSDPEAQLFLKNGPLASVSRKLGAVEDWKEIEVAEWFEPVDEAVTLTAFDLMMPFIYWSEWAYEGVTKIGGRPAHAFLMKAPERLMGNPMGLYGVVVFLDEDFNVLRKAEYISEDETVLKSFRLLNLKKVDDAWLPKIVDFLDELSRDKTRLVIKEAAMHRNFSEHPLGRGEIPMSVPRFPLSEYTEVR